MKKSKNDDEMLTLEQKFSKIVNFRSKKWLKQITIKNQIDELKNNKNCKIDIKNNDIKDLLKTRTLSLYYQPYEPIFYKYNKKTIPRQDLVNKNIRKDYNLGNRQEIIIDENFSIDSLINMCKSDNKNDYNSHRFSDIMMFNKIDDKRTEMLTSKIKNIDLIFKTQITYFLSLMSYKHKIHWSAWIINSIPESFSDYKREKLINFLYKFDNYKQEIEKSVNDMSLGKLKTIMEIILKSKSVGIDERDEFVQKLFIKSLNPNINIDTTTYLNFIGKTITLNRFRNSVMHSESFNTFLLKELFEQIKYLKSKKYLNLRFWLVKNPNEDKSIKTFVDNHWLFKDYDNKKMKYEQGLFKYDKRKTKNIEKLMQFKSNLTNALFDDVQIRYYIEFENLKDGNVKCLEFDVLSTLNLWFKEK